MKKKCEGRFISKKNLRLYYMFFKFIDFLKCSQSDFSLKLTIFEVNLKEERDFSNSYFIDVTLFEVIDFEVRFVRKSQFSK